MKKMKVFKLVSFIFLTTLFLVACQSHRNRHQDTITVFDSDNQQILQTSNTEALEWFNDILDEIDDSETDEDGVIELPADAKINYSYDFNNREGVSAHFTTYKNYPLVTISNIPGVPDITLELSDLEADELNHPNNWIK